jgi:hypothetical protein
MSGCGKYLKKRDPSSRGEKVQEKMIGDEILEKYKDKITQQNQGIIFEENPGILIYKNIFSTVSTKKVLAPFDFQLLENENDNTRYYNSISKLLSDKNDKVIIAESGGGKTFFLKYILLKESKEGGLPIYWHWEELLKELKKISVGQAVIYGYFKDFLIDDFDVKSEKFEKAIKDLLNERRIVMLIDNFDEIEVDESLLIIRRMLKNFKNDSPKKQKRDYIVIALNSFNHRNSITDIFRKHNFNLYRINPLKDTQIFEYVKDFFKYNFWYEPSFRDKRHELIKNHIGSKQVLLGLVRNPFFFNLLMKIYHEDGNFPDVSVNTKSNIYEKGIEKLLYGSEKSSNSSETFAQLRLDDSDIYNLLREIAYEYYLGYVNGKTQEFGVLPKDELVKIICDRYSKKVNVEPNNIDGGKYANILIDYLSDETGIMIKNINKQFGFYHRVLLEYLAAQELNRRYPTFAESFDCIISMLNNRNFQDILGVAVFKVKMMGNPTETTFNDSLAENLIDYYNRYKNSNAPVLLDSLLKNNESFSLENTKKIQILINKEEL